MYSIYAFVTIFFSSKYNFKVHPYHWILLFLSIFISLQYFSIWANWYISCIILFYIFCSLSSTVVIPLMHVLKYVYICISGLNSLGWRATTWLNLWDICQFTCTSFYSHYQHMRILVTVPFHKYLLLLQSKLLQT